MKLRNGTVFIAASSIAMTALTCAGADAAPAPQRVLSRGAITVPRATPLPRLPSVAGRAHDVSGAIVSLSGNSVSLRLRDGRVLSIDATDAIASGRFSAPLFVGKFVEVTGPVDLHRVLHAQTITRLPRVDSTTPADR